jgi:hypothetical protein
MKFLPIYTTFQQSYEFMGIKEINCTLKQKFGSTISSHVTAAHYLTMTNATVYDIPIKGTQTSTNPQWKSETVLKMWQ